MNYGDFAKSVIELYERDGKVFIWDKKVIPAEDISPCYGIDSTIYPFGAWRYYMGNGTGAILDAREVTVITKEST